MVQIAKKHILIILLGTFYLGNIAAVSPNEAYEQAETLINKAPINQEKKTTLLETTWTLIDGLRSELATMEKKEFAALIEDMINGEKPNNSATLDEESEQLAKAIQREEDLRFAKSLETDERLAKQLQEKSDEALARTLEQEIKESEKPKKHLSAVVQAWPTIKTDFVLPTVFSGIPIVHLNAPERQKGDASCGSRALLTAWAIDQTVFNNKQPVAKHLLPFFNAKKGSFIQKDDLEGQTIINKNKTLGVKNLFLCDKDLKSIMCANAISNAEIDEDAIHKAITQVSATGQTLHFIMNTGGHWVLLSYIKERDQKTPMLVYIDSVNGLLKNDSQATKTIKAIWEKYIKIYHQ